jgi:hypothetical protein
MAGDHKHWGQIGATLLIGGAAAAAAWLLGTTIAVTQDGKRVLPVWPTFAFLALALFGLYLVLAPVIGWRVPTDKTDRVKRRAEKAMSRQAQVNAEAERQRRTEVEAKREVESHRWQPAAFNCMVSANEHSLCLELHRPDKSRPDDFIGKMARCEVIQSAHVYLCKETEYDRARSAFVVPFPQGLSPEGTFVALGRYHVTWWSEVLDEPRKWEFKLGRFGEYVP